MGKKKDGSLRVPSAEQVQAPTAPTPAKIQLDFDSWWMLVSQIRNFSPSVKGAVKKHFEARGFMVNKNFDDGLKDFGF